MLQDKFSFRTKFLEVARQGLVYGLGNVSQQLIGFLLLLVYTSRLVPEEYGLLTMLLTINALLGVLLGMGFSTTLFRFFFGKQGETRKQVVSTVLFWMMGIGGAAILVIWMTAGSISRLIFGTDQYALHVRLVSVTLALNLLQTIPLAVLRAQKRALHYATLVVSLFLLGVLLNIYAVVVLEKGVLGILTANAFTTLVYVMVGLFLCREFVGLAVSKQLLGEMLRYTLPLVPGAIGGYILQRSDRWFLQQYADLGVVGLYSLGYQFGNIVNVLVIHPFQLVWFPTALELRKKTEAKGFFERVLTYFVLIACWVGLGISLFGKDVLYLMAKPDYFPAQSYIPWIVLAYIIFGSYYVVNMGIFMMDKTSYVIWILGFASLANIVLNFLLIPPFGAIGAAVATLLSYFLLFLIAYVVNQQLFPLQYEWVRIVKILAAFLILLACGQWSFNYLLLSLAYKSVLMVAYWILLLMFGFYLPGEQLLMKETIRKFSRKAAVLFGHRVF